ncbi:MAG: GGDEF domain-containing protein [Gammaproteobacteria bacterium]|jgi:diguanylate cyclase (GGDEF)-like protein|nr:GGDEF domain-containing protein [Gammaproteobacteria bacterium]MBT4492894.1 GGDEF domain-containing protein [Gammaproteobacteria bacterium]MBT7371393.1 GGDEF domain-containing protein [Gammaproteobacteria bacterium]
MNKIRIHLLIGINTILVYGLILFLLPGGSTEQWVVIGIAMAVMMVAPILVINKALNTLEVRATEAESELEAVRDELVKVRENLSAITTLDELTGCYNESHFKEVLLQHSAMSERGSYEFTVAVLQVDQFNHIVDNHGLASANETLQLFTRIVKAALREVDVVSRLGSDIFGLLLSGASEEDAVMIIHRISQLISQIKIKDDDDLHVTASGGITCFHGTESTEDLIAHASKALEFAVEQGRDRVAGFNYKAPEPEGEVPAEAESAAEEESSRGQD